MATTFKDQLKNEYGIDVEGEVDTQYAVDIITGKKIPIESVENQGASITLYGEEHASYPGAFEIAVGAGKKFMHITKDGELVFNKKDFPNYTPDDFAKEFVRAVKRCWEFKA